MSSISCKSIEGTGADISEYLKLHPDGRFRLTLIESSVRRKVFDQAKWDEAMRIIESFRGRLPSLPDEAFTTDALYD